VLEKKMTLGGWVAAGRAQTDGADQHAIQGRAQKIEDNLLYLICV